MAKIKSDVGVSDQGILKWPNAGNYIIENKERDKASSEIDAKPPGPNNISPINFSTAIEAKDLLILHAENPSNSIH